MEKKADIPAAFCVVTPIYCTCVALLALLLGNQKPMQLVLQRSDTSNKSMNETIVGRNQMIVCRDRLMTWPWNDHGMINDCCLKTCCFTACDERITTAKCSILPSLPLAISLGLVIEGRIFSKCWCVESLSTVVLAHHRAIFPWKNCSTVGRQVVGKTIPYGSIE
jgi:hypothetical protein